MPIFLYQVHPLISALTLIVFIESVSLIGLFLARKFVLPRLRYDAEINDAVSGTVQAIGVFYGITVGLIAVGVWNSHSQSADLVSREAALIGALHRDLGGYPSPLKEELRGSLRAYTVFVINEAWPAQKAGRGHSVGRGTAVMDEFQARLLAFEPANSGQQAIHAETLRAYNNLIESRRLRIDAVNEGLSGIMWAVIWVGAVISIGVAYFFHIEDAKIHFILIALMAGFLAMVLFMIIVNDRPFYGYVSIPADPYQIILDRVLDLSK
ncbi:MAG TPA: hypothetical protein VJT71_19380 [Pyrinomonadaceae bacterium]|nr:hypothetical protein [Pyrinomonadaceae bacterium]